MALGLYGVRVKYAVPKEETIEVKAADYQSAQRLANSVLSKKGKVLETNIVSEPEEATDADEAA